jgi:hypothetical protein
MPMGPGLGGFAYFAGAKFPGYSAFAHLLRKRFDDTDKTPWRTLKLGGTLTLIGIGAGVCYGLVIGLAGQAMSEVKQAQWLGYVLFFGGLLPVRLAEWYWLLRIAFKERVRRHPETPRSLALGTLVSYGLDAIGVAAAFVLPGGMWVC